MKSATAVHEALGNIRTVLVGTSHPGNIGSAARAMKTMGLSRLVLVAPKIFPSPDAIWRAVGGSDILARAQVVDDLATAVADCALVVGSSARERSIPWPLENPRQCGAHCATEAAAGHQVALVFGREDRGLDNDELHLCNAQVRIPANPDYSSLNLAAAVQVLAYEVRMGLADAPCGERWDLPPATARDMANLYEHFERVLVGLNFLDPEHPRRLPDRLRRMLVRIRPDRMEVNILRGFLSAVERGKDRKKQ